MNFEHGRSTTVLTDKGYIRGFKNNGVYQFYGVDYARASRFMPPSEVDAWSGIKDATNYGFTCYPFLPDHIGNNLKNPHRFWPQSEDCLNLNIWTKNINNSIKKPVVVWFHGGAFLYGSSLEQAAYDGFNLCDFGDIVVVTLNHRLNILGYLDLSSFSDKYRRSANVGNLDLIEALKWVNRNIENFGGDKNNVTIFGQSGGGAKVMSVMNMPASEGLYSKAMVMSGTLDKRVTESSVSRLSCVKGMLNILDIPENNVELLENVPHRAMADAYNQAFFALGGKRGVDIGPSPNEDFIGDPTTFPFSKQAKMTPLIIGSVFSEFTVLPEDLHRNEMSEEDVISNVENELGNETAGKAIPLFKKAFPDKKTIDILTYDSSTVRNATIEFVRKRDREGCASTFNYFFTPVFGILEGQTALHSSDIPFMFHNTTLVPSSDLGAYTWLLEKNMAGRFVQYAYTGKPQLDGQEEWIPCRNGKVSTLVYDRNSRVEEEFDTELLETLRSAKAPNEEH